MVSRACNCGQSRPGVWDRRGILHTASECRYRDRLVSATYALRAGASSGVFR